MNFYDFMDKMDKFCIEKQDGDFRNMEVRCTEIIGLEILYITDGKKSTCFLLNKEKRG